MSMVLLNCLIAIMADACTRVGPRLPMPLADLAQIPANVPCDSTVSCHVCILSCPECTAMSLIRKYLLDGGCAQCSQLPLR